MSSSSTTPTPFHLKQLYRGKKKDSYYRFDFSNDERWDAMLKAVNAALQEVSQIPTLEINFVDKGVEAYGLIETKPKRKRKPRVKDEVKPVSKAKNFVSSFKTITL